MSIELTEIDTYAETFRVEYENVASPLGGTTRFYLSEVEGRERVEVGDGPDGRRNARTLAAALAAAGVESLDVLPPEFGPSAHDGDEWEAWADDSFAVPARVATASRAAIAGWLKVVHRQREDWIASEVGVSEDTVVQYLSDLREGRR
ncbi:hypothetical protein [Halorussus pelagicus]|uniref:hypothetical protein n=1 Tax=Halorussus pelagicus TaxID=2505977 RepID=UPI000FFB48A4|nr:hypothetical protein [Halorussus pelagicus]